MLVKHTENKLYTSNCEVASVNGDILAMVKRRMVENLSLCLMFELLQSGCWCVILTPAVRYLTDMWLIATGVRFYFHLVLLKYNVKLTITDDIRTLMGIMAWRRN